MYPLPGVFLNTWQVLLVGHASAIRALAAAAAVAATAVDAAATAAAT